MACSLPNAGRAGCCLYTSAQAPLTLTLPPCRDGGPRHCCLQRTTTPPQRTPHGTRTGRESEAERAVDVQAARYRDRIIDYSKLGRSAFLITLWFLPCFGVQIPYRCCRPQARSWFRPHETDVMNAQDPRNAVALTFTNSLGRVPGAVLLSSGRDPNLGAFGLSATNNSIVPQ